MARHRAEFPDSGIEKDSKDPLLSYLADKGIEHEARFLKTLSSRLEIVVTIDDDLSDELKLEKNQNSYGSGSRCHLSGVS